MISTVDPEARHGHKSRNRRFDGYKAHLSIDPDSELIDEVVATAANTPTGRRPSELLAPHHDEEDKPEVLGDSAYADGATRDTLGPGVPRHRQVPTGAQLDRPVHQGPLRRRPRSQHRHLPGRAAGDHQPHPGRGGRASFKVHCKTCPMRTACTKSRAGRSISVDAHEAVLQRARAEQHEPGWAERYRADRPIVERKIARFARRPWGGRRARTRGKARIATDLDTRAGAINWARLATLGLQHGANGWVIQGT